MGYMTCFKCGHSYDTGEIQFARDIKECPECIYIDSIKLNTDEFGYLDVDKPEPPSEIHIFLSFLALLLKLAVTLLIVLSLGNLINYLFSDYIMHIIFTLLIFTLFFLMYMVHRESFFDRPEDWE